MMIFKKEVARGHVEKVKEMDEQLIKNGEEI